MIPFRTQIKFFFDNPEAVEVAAFTAVFQRWIQQHAIDELLIDVADYRHVFGGPGIMLIGHASDYAIENRDGRIGLVYTRKRQIESDLLSQLRTSFQFALTACELLEAETTFEPRLKFRADDIEIRFADRLQLPNRAESFDLVKDDLAVVLTELYGGNPAQIAPVATDARHLFTVKALQPEARNIADLVYKFQPSAES
jgi:hypothetical protein